MRGAGIRITARRLLHPAVVPPHRALDHVRPSVAIRDRVLQSLQEEPDLLVGKVDVDARRLHSRVMTRRQAWYARLALMVAAIAAMLVGVFLSDTPLHDLTLPLVVAGMGTILILLVMNHAIWLWEMLRFTVRSNYTRRL